MARQVRHTTAVAALVLLLPAYAAAQGVRIQGTTWMQFVDLRPLVPDTAGFVSGDRMSSAPVLQDLTMSAWGLGAGISAHAHLRARTSIGHDNLPWPRSADHFDALDAYVDIDREQFRGRLGRQWTSGALGVYNFDGASLLLRRGSASIEGYGGASLVLGLNEGYDGGGIGALDELPPDERAYLVGVKTRWRPRATTSLSAVWQRSIRSDMGAVYGDRGSLAASTRLFGVGIDGEWTQDLAQNQVTEARLGAHRAIGLRRQASVEFRRSRPYFELWSIWGAFAPVGFDEARGNLAFGARGGRLQLNVGGGYRAYEATNAQIFSSAFRDNGWRATADAAYTGSERWQLAARYAVDIGPGASSTDGTLGGSWVQGSRLTLGASFSTLQHIYEYRLGTGRIVGGSVNAAVRFTEETRVVLDAALYHHSLSPTAFGTDWGQRRASLRFEWTLGGDPGTAAGRAR